MKNNRRDFIRKSGLAGLGLAGALGCSRQPAQKEPFPQTHQQSFNMSGYAAPKLDLVRIGIIGLGNRGSGTVVRLASIEGVEIRALCDLEPDRVSRAIESIRQLGHKPDAYSGNEDEWKKVCERADIDLIAVVTPWSLHTPMCVYAMEHDKHVFTELPASMTIDGCWQLVETSERTRKHCVQGSMSCHGFGIKDWSIPTIVLNMLRQGYFGDIIHAEGAYIHDIAANIFSDKYHRRWRLKENTDRHGNLYPQHGLVPIIQMMDINYGDSMEYLASVSSDDFTMARMVERLAAGDEAWQPYTGRDYRGNINTSIIRTRRGRTIMVQHDTSTPRPGVRFHLISCTKGIYEESHPPASRIATGHEGWMPKEELESLTEKYIPEMMKRYNEFMSQATSVETQRGGYYRVMPLDWRIVDCLRNGLPMDMDVYEAAASSSLIPLSEWSVANGSAPVRVPDFTCGAWETNDRGMDIELQRGGGTTRLV
jgi:hypothetical protein